MSDLVNAAEQVIKVTEWLKGLSALAEIVKRLGSVEDALRSTEDALARAQDRHRELLAENERMKEAQAREDAAFAEAQRVKESELRSREAAARAQAQAIERDATAEAQAIVAKAHESAEGLTQAHAERMKEAAAELVAVRRNVEATKGELVALEKQKATLEASIQSIRKAARAVLE